MGFGEQCRTNDKSQKTIPQKKRPEKEKKNGALGQLRKPNEANIENSITHLRERVTSRSVMNVECFLCVVFNQINEWSGG